MTLKLEQWRRWLKRMINSKLVIKQRRVLEVPNPARLAPPLVISLGALLMALVASHYTGLSLADLTDDAATTEKRGWLIGVLSNLGSALLAMAVGVSLLAVTLRKECDAGQRRGSTSFWLACCSTLLLLDDAFLLHEGLLLHVFGIPEVITQVAIGGLIITVLMLFRRAIAASFIFALPAVICWIVSVLSDSLLDDRHLAALLIEDGFKLLGICLWLQFCTEMAKRSLRQLIRGL